MKCAVMAVPMPWWQHEKEQLEKGQGDRPDGPPPHRPSPEVAIPIANAHFSMACSWSAALAHLNSWKSSPGPLQQGFTWCLFSPHLSTLGVAQNPQTATPVWTGLTRAAGGCSKASPNSLSDHSLYLLTYKT